MTSYIEQEFAYRVFPLINTVEEMQIAEDYFHVLFRNTCKIPNSKTARLRNY